MHARFLATRWLVVGLVIVAFALGGVAGCGSSDKWAGTWVVVGDEGTGFEIDKKDATTYNVHDPDGSNAFDATLSGNTLTGRLDTTANGQPVTGDVTITMNGDKLSLKIVVDGVKKPILMELKKK